MFHSLSLLLLLVMMLLLLLLLVMALSSHPHLFSRPDTNKTITTKKQRPTKNIIWKTKADNKSPIYTFHAAVYVISRWLLLQASGLYTLSFSTFFFCFLFWVIFFQWDTSTSLGKISLQKPSQFVNLIELFPGHFL